MKKCGVYVVISIVGLGSILGVSMLRERERKIDIQAYIGKSYEEELPKELEQKGIEVKYGDNNEVLALLINRKNYEVDSIEVGDSVDKIEEIYPKEWINKGKHTVKISYGRESHYGVATDFIIYVIGNNNKIQSIIIGKTAEFIDSPLPDSNKQAKELLQGKWRSQDERVLSFEEDLFNDTYMDVLWDQQTYKVIAPNRLMLSRQKEEQSEKLTLNFWLDESKLYLFTINEKGMPIEESIEVFSKF
ncbi:MAG: hypothetical protein ACLSH8_13140 [Zhenhengia sp.]|jgi:hypothetical protein|uniref:hypothetical protein n=1 Tax=Zhenhengia sp. TaxID=2944208 RepID=UPI00290BEB4A|nr:hypothetical protein [Clostridiales bacterium]MDU6975988.1 hypothetical protein [Clostridiales bacterium]